MPEMGLKMFLTVNGVELFYQKTGQGRPIILLHGNGEDHHVFDKVTQRLSQRFTVYAVDSRDHGQSGRVTRLSYDDMAEDIIAMIKTLGLVRPALLGFSDGGIVGLMVAFRHPALLSMLISCGPNASPKDLKRWFLAVIKAGYRFTKDSKLALMLNEPKITAKNLFNIQIPVLILAGECDICTKRHFEWIASNIPKGYLRVLRGETHSSYLKNGDRLSRMVFLFVQSVENTKRRVRKAEKDAL